ncbi:MAG: biotin--[acetyl-CoA-carboxylase] ligase [Eubacteriaceae bacterium]|nr:biotin--[acetyl-CoA-carboxylase] ligase [Eubacteriaceae bacterium]
MIKDEVFRILWESGTEFVSGQDMASDLCVSRTAVWKAVRSLRERGYQIESVPKLGYRLMGTENVLSVSGIRQFLRHGELDIEVHRCLTSTNTVLKKMAEDGIPEGKVVIALEQTAGRGRMGRSFYSPIGSGLYMSLLIRPDSDVRDMAAMTAFTAVCVSRTIEEICGISTCIKWVNDVMMGGRKICGILTEGAVESESGRLGYAVIGIGINIDIPSGGFPEEIVETAGSLYRSSPGNMLSCRLAAGILDRIMDVYRSDDRRDCLDEYRRRMYLLGRRINIMNGGKIRAEATAVDVADDLGLIVRYDDGTTEKLSSGEVSVRERKH